MWEGNDVIIHVIQDEISQSHDSKKYLGTLQQLYKHHSTLLPNLLLPYAAARAADPPPMISPPPQATAYYASESLPHGQSTLVPHVSDLRMKIWFVHLQGLYTNNTKAGTTFAGAFLLSPHFFPFSLFHGDDSTDPQSLFFLLIGTDSGQTMEVQTHSTGTGVPPRPCQLGCINSIEFRWIPRCIQDKRFLNPAQEALSQSLPPQVEGCINSGNP